MKSHCSAALVVAPAPFLHTRDTTSRIMWMVTASLAPAAFMGILYFGINALMTMAVCIGSCLIFELLYQKVFHKPVTALDGSAVLTGLLLAFNLPPAMPFPLLIFGSFVAIILTKHLFGGIGHTLFNPALMGRAFLMLAFPRFMAGWVAPNTLFSFDAITAATPLGVLKTRGTVALAEMFNGHASMYAQLFLGQRGGCIGETAIVALLAGALFLLYKGYITWHTPLSYIGTVAVIAWIFGGNASLFSGDPIVHILSGGVFLGAFYMATDYVTSPSTPKGQLVLGIGCGVITMLIRLKGSYPEGCMFSILIMNIFAPVIDRMFQRTWAVNRHIEFPEQNSDDPEKGTVEFTGGLTWIDQVAGKRLPGAYALLCLTIYLIPAVAVTTSVKGSLMLGSIVMFTQITGILFIGSVRRLIHPAIRIPVFLGTIATCVTIGTMIAAAFFPSVYHDIRFYAQVIALSGSLPAGIALFTKKYRLVPVLLEGAIAGFCFLAVLVFIGFVREFFGSGMVWGRRVVTDAPFSLLMLPGGGLLVLGFVAALAAYVRKRSGAPGSRNNGEIVS